MKRFAYHFRTFTSFVEEVVGFKVSRNCEIIGINLPPTLRQQFGTGAQRHYPYGCLMVLPQEVPVPPFQELPDEADWEPEPDLIFHHW